MNQLRWPLIVGMAVVLAAATAARAQRPPLGAQSPHVGYAYPAGGRQGTTFEVTVGGQYLDDVSEAHVSGGGVRVTLGKHYRPLTPMELNQLRQKLDDARKRLQGNSESAPMGGFGGFGAFMKVAREAGLSDAQVKALMDFRKKMNDPKRQANPQIAETVALEVKLAATAAPGQRELRLVTPAGMSNPLAFYVGQLPEHRESEPNDRSPDTLREGLPLVVNGQIMPGDVDRFSFKARAGARLVIAASARGLIPYLADAVPGWFQAVLTLYDARGSEVACADAWGYRQDPVLFYEVPKDGEYVLAIRDGLYRGREDFIYRITLGEMPYITSIFPLGGRAGTQVSVELAGWHLPVDKLNVEANYERGHPLRSVFVGRDDQISNRMPFAVDTLPECLEKEPNDTPENAQAVTVPMIVNGRIGQPGDVDVYRFDGRAGDRIVAEVYARRLGSPLDSLLTLSDATGRELATNDDYEDRGAPLTTHHADSRIAATLPASGSYYLQLGDAQQNGGPELAYRLHIRPPWPDFELRVVPSSLSVRAGLSAPMTVYALRRDGFAEDILLELKDAPPGFRLDGGLVPANQDKARLTLTVPSTPTEEPLVLRLEGRATIHGRKITHPAVPAEDMLQAFAYHHLVPAKDWTVAVTSRGQFARYSLQLTGEERVRLPPGGTAQVRMAMPGKSPLGEIHLELSEPPEGISIESVAPGRDGTAVRFRADAKKLKPGLKGNLIVSAFWERAPNESKPAPKRQQRFPMGTLPAIPFEITAGRVRP